MSEKKPQKKRAAKRSSKPASNGSKQERLGPGGLDKLVLGYMRRHNKDAPHTPSAIAKGIKRSSGAVANCLGRQEKQETVRLVNPKPRQYELVEKKRGSAPPCSPAEALWWRSSSRVYGRRGPSSPAPSTIPSRRPAAGSRLPPASAAPLGSDRDPLIRRSAALREGHRQVVVDFVPRRATSHG